ncbi:hypothetical protein FRC03_008785 [Tulasnella sp. 419]|nr:hypothetical protein FRC03_008785 [Tulasnella sp. 419]
MSSNPTIVQDDQYKQRISPPADPNAKDRVTVTATPAMTIVHGRVNVGDDHSTSIRSWTPLKNVGVGSFGEVQLCDWHSPLPPNTQLSPMQCGAGARPEWVGKRLVALKLTKKRWERGWAECKHLKELESLRKIPSHPNIIPLYDAFVLPETKQLYFVFECMEGNLYQLIKSRRGRPLAGGLVASIYRQVVSGLAHIHASGYFHRDMKPENLLVTTTGLADYSPTSPLAPQPTALAPPDKDVMVIVKLADFGLARETDSKPPYTEYVSTRWYRAPEVLLRSTNYSNPVDMWALGTILAELINLKPIFPGQGEVDQVAKITDILGDPTDRYGVDERGRVVGGGKWSKGIKMARAVGFVFKPSPPVPFRPLFDVNVPTSLVDCIADLLRYDPDLRLTAQQCMEHPYWKETEHSQRQAITPFNPHVTPSQGQQTRRPTHISVPPPDTNASSTSSNNSLRAAVAGLGIQNGHHRRHHSQTHFNVSVTPGNGNPGLPLPLVSPRNLPPSHSLSPTHIKPPFLLSTEHRQQPGHISPSPSPNLPPQAPTSQVPGLFSPTTPSSSPNPLVGTGPNGAMSQGQIQYLAAQQGHYTQQQYPYHPQQGFHHHQQVSRSASHPHLPTTSRSAGTVGGGSTPLYNGMPGTSKSGGAASGTSDLVERLQLADYGMDMVPPVPPLPREYVGGLGVERASVVATVGAGSELEHDGTMEYYDYGGKLCLLKRCFVTDCFFLQMVQWIFHQTTLK